MSTPLDEYHALIDGLVAKRDGFMAPAVHEQRFWHRWETMGPECLGLVASLTVTQRAALAVLLQHVRDTAISDTLAYLREQMVHHDLRLMRNGVELPREPHHTMNSDWWCRCQGEPWPEREGEVFESGKRD